MRKFALMMGCCVVGASALTACGASDHAPPEARVATAPQALQNLQQAFPNARVDMAAGRARRIYGSALSTGATPFEAAERFRREQANALSLDALDLAPATGSGAPITAGARPQPIGLMWDAKSGRHKFLLYRYAQTKGGLAVHRAGLSVVVKNEGNNPVVWASSSGHDLSAFAIPQLTGPGVPDADKSLRAVRGFSDFAGHALKSPAAFSKVSASELVVYAGTEDTEAPARLALEYSAEAQSPPGKWRLVADAQTGDVLRVEDGVLFADIAGSVTGNGTQGDVAAECAPELPVGLAFAEVDGPSPAATFTNLTGAFTLPNAGTAAIDVTSNMGGQFFDVSNFAGSTEQLVQSVAPPGPASFLHNSANTDPLVLAQINGYTNANDIRGFLLKYLPNYPVISGQSNFPVIVNRTDGFCPGNAWYDPGLVTINFCQGSTSFGNTSFASVAHHEFGHHIVQSGGSGQGAYGEGMGDTIAALFAGVPGLGFGFFLNQCTTPLRNAQNTCQFSASCSSCGSEIHACGQLISGTAWSIRQQLAVTHPETFADIINSLMLSSIPMHVGTLITSSIAIDLLTLDDDDANLDNGTPHYAEICAGFQAHGMTCPAIKTGLTVSPTAAFEPAGPVGGPFTPESTSYTLANVGPQASIGYQVSPLAAAPWLNIGNATGQLALGQTATVALSVNQAVAATLAQGTYSASVQFTNLTDGQGNATRTVNLQVGQPVAIFSEKFENGLGAFTVGAEATNRWHVTSSCASAQTGHSLPNSLYFGVDATCNFNTGAATAGTATSSTITINDTSNVKLRFNYLLTTEHLSSFDKAAVSASVNGGAYTVLASNNTGGLALVDGSNTWSAAEVDLAPLLAGLSSPTLSLRVSFDSVDSIANTGAGFLVDDVEVRAFTASCSSDAQCNDGLFCNGAEHCVNGTCAAGTAVVCSDSVSCTVDSCNESTDSCVFAANNALCSDAQACNGAETCNASTGCQAGTPLNCDDGSVCTADSCNAATGCQHTPVSCDDGNACTTDSCNAVGGCQHAALNCDDGNACTNDACSAGACTHANNTATCADDGNTCTSDVCSAGVCTHPTNGTCGANPCASFCANPVNFSGNFQSGNLGTGAICYQTTGPVNGGNCGNFVSPRTLSVNGTVMACNNGNWPTLPAKVNGGYCVTTTAGNQPWAFFTTW